MDRKSILADVELLAAHAVNKFVCANAWFFSSLKNDCVISTSDFKQVQNTKLSATHIVN